LISLAAIETPVFESTIEQFSKYHSADGDSTFEKSIFSETQKPTHY